LCKLLDIKQARPLLEEYATEELIDPRLGNHYSENEVYCMLHAASLCIQRDPQCRPRMSQVKEVFLSRFAFCQTLLDEKNSQLLVTLMVVY